MIEECIVTPDW